MIASPWPAVYEPVISRLRGLRPAGENRWAALCPAHEDLHPSLSVSVSAKSGKLLLKCHSPCACPLPAILDAIGAPESALFPDALDKPAPRGTTVGSDAARRPQRRFVSAYSYNDQSGKLIYQKVRWEPKDFSMRRPNPAFDRAAPLADGGGEWIYSVPSDMLILYRLQDTLAAIKERQDRMVFLMEGEKAVNRAWSCGLVATCSPTGAGRPEGLGNWNRWSYVEPLAGANVVLVPDNDPVDPQTGVRASWAHMERAGLSLLGWASRVRWLTLPDLPEKGDFYDFAEGLDADGVRRRLTQAVRSMPDRWTPPDPGPVALSLAGESYRATLRAGRQPASWHEVLGIASAGFARLGLCRNADEFWKEARMIAAVLSNRPEGI